MRVLLGLFLTCIGVVAGAIPNPYDRSNVGLFDGANRYRARVLPPQRKTTMAAITVKMTKGINGS